MPDITTDPLKAAKDLAGVLEQNAKGEKAARWKLAWTTLYCADGAAMAATIDQKYGSTVANAFRDARTAVKAIAHGYGGELPPDHVREHCEQWAPKTWQQLTAKVIRPLSFAGEIPNTDPTVLRKQLDEEKAAAKQTEADSPQG